MAATCSTGHPQHKPREKQGVAQIAKIKLDSHLYDGVKKIAEIAGYSSTEEFIIHIIEKELSQLEAADTDEKIEERLRGLGYIE